jgi:serine protease Do
VSELVVAIGHEVSRPANGGFEGVGSGIAIGVHAILTAAHVVSGLDRPMVSIAGTKLRAHLQKSDRERDLALLALDEGTCRRTLPLSDGVRLQLGQALFSIGYSAGLSPVVTRGVYSGDDAAKRGGQFDTALLTDAAMAPGSSGGALITEDGSLVGINDVANVSFGVHRAIPMSVVKKFLHEAE